MKRHDTHIVTLVDTIIFPHNCDHDHNTGVYMIPLVVGTNKGIYILCIMDIFESVVMIGLLITLTQFRYVCLNLD